MTTAYVPRGAQHATTSSRELAFSVRVDPRRLLMLMAVVIALLVIASTVAVGALAFFRWPEGSLGHETVKMFWLDTEHNLPTLYQFLTLAFAAALMFRIAKQPGVGVAADRLRWRVLASAFVFLALDEFLRIHETVGDTSSFHFGAVGLLIYAPVVVLLGLWWMPLLLRLDARARMLLLAVCGSLCGWRGRRRIVEPAVCGHCGQVDAAVCRAGDARGGPRDGGYRAAHLCAARAPAWPPCGVHDS